MAAMMLMKINLTMTAALLVKSIGIKIISAFDFTTFFTFYGCTMFFHSLLFGCFE